MSDPGRVTEAGEKVGGDPLKSKSEKAAPKASFDPILVVPDRTGPHDLSLQNPEDDTMILRRSKRDRQLTEKAKLLQEAEYCQLTTKINSLYESWRQYASAVRKELKTPLTIERLQELHDGLKTRQDHVLATYGPLKSLGITEKRVVAKVDNCCSISFDLLEILMRRRLETEEELDLDRERRDARALKSSHPSVFGDSVSEALSASSHQTSASIISMKTSADAEKAEKMAKAKVLREEQQQRSVILQLQVQMEEERMKLEAIQADADIIAAEAKCDVFAEAVKQHEGSEVRYELYSIAPDSEPPPEHPAMPIARSPEKSSPSAPVASPSTNVINETSLCLALANAMDRNRLPVPTPKVFSGNPIDYNTFKRSFKTLIENKGISAEERTYYLQQYVSGDAKDAIAGCFFGNQESDYQRAWETLEKRFGHPFKIAEAFRKRLENWPRVGQRDGPALQKYADLLRSCLDAAPHIKGLRVLDDCKENQKLVAKLPDWAISRWSRIVTDTLDKTSDFPDFSKFVAFVEKEAHVAMHPVSSLAAVKGLNPREGQPKMEEKGRSAGAFATSAEKTPPTPSAPASRATTAEKPKVCPFCGPGHWLSSCNGFTTKTIEERTAFIREQKRCFSCLRTGHFSTQCNSKHICRTCEGRHPTVLHDRSKSTRPITQQSWGTRGATQRGENGAVSLKTDIGQSSTTNVLPVWVSSSSDPHREKLVYALLDTQSDSTFIDESVCRELLVQTEPVKLNLTTMMAEGATVMSNRASGLRVRGYASGQHINLPVAYTREYIPLDRGHIPTWQTAQRWAHLTSIVQEMPPLLDCQVGLLIGYNCSSALAPRQVITGERDQPYAIRTDLGWSIVGRLGTADPTNPSGFCYRVCLKESPAATPRDVLNVLEKDFADSKEHAASVSQEDIQFLKFLEDNVIMNQKGHVEMPLPFKKRPHLPDNKRTAEVRLAHLKRKFDRDETYKEKYIKFINTMLKDGDAERVQDEPPPGEVFYLPHHGILHPKKPDKLRVVFDCSAKHRGTCLNDHLLSGPDLTNSLFGVLCRFRRERIAVMCDIEKMFHRFYVQPQDRDFLRFLWYDGGDTSNQPQEYRMNVHLFGAKSSPGCANFGLKYLSKLYEERFPLAARFIRQDFYVDDGVTSVSSPEEAITLIHEARELCSMGNLRLHKFISNDRTVVESIPTSERSSEIQEIDLNKEELPMERTLGVSWNIESDVLTFQIGIKERPDTRRGILSVVGSMYDPLGFISPFVLEAKSILHEMCKRGVDWDEPIFDNLRPRWERWREDIPKLENVNLPRCYLPPDFGTPQRVELHHFSDASTTGYGMCSYLRYIRDDHVHCCLVLGKARVSPTKIVTIPRLELTAAVVAVKMSLKLSEELQVNIDDEYFWTDSQVVLGYIANEAKKFHVFVSNRVQIIRDNTDTNQWQYVSTKENPADHTSRGLTAAELLTSTWFTGPKFLWETDPIERHSMNPALMLGDPEVRAEAFNVQAVAESTLLDRLSNFSTWNRLTRSIARIQRIARKPAGALTLSADEIDQAGLAVLKLVQAEAFKEELKALRNHREVTSISKLHNLNPYLHEGLIRVGGRLRKSAMPFSQKHPVVLPKCHVTRLLIAHCHHQIRHQGRGQTLNEIRSQGYWILGGSNMVAGVIRNCVPCRRLRRPVEEQRMADLPQDRVEPAAPFTYCGMDCFGPFITKQGRKEYRRYGLLFTCLCSRAVHIEVVEDMTTDAFINALRCFIAIRGTVKQIRSDQGSNFIGADNELRAAMKELDPDRMKNFLTAKQCTFLFNAPHASHSGGVWERQIKTVRNVLRATLTLYPGRLDDASLRCYMYEAMSIVNSRPLTPVNMSDPNEVPPLTPNHLITMKTTPPLPPPGEFVKEDMYARKRWRRVQFLSEQFWSRWRKEYLQNLQTRAKWNIRRRNLKVGDVVLLKDQDVPRMKWPLGVITIANPDDDGLVRRVRVRTGSRGSGPHCSRTELERPVQKLVLLVEQD